MTLLKVKYKRQRLRRKIVQEVKVYTGGHNLLVNIEEKAKRCNLNKSDYLRRAGLED